MIGYVTQGRFVHHRHPQAPAPGFRAHQGLRQAEPDYFELEAKLAPACRRLMTPSQIAGFATWLIGQAGALTDIVTSADDQQFLANYTEGLRRIADNGLSIPEAQRGACQALTEIAFMALVEAGKGTPGADTIVGNIHSTTSALLAARPAETDEDARRRKTRGGLSLAGGVLLLGLGILLVRRRG